ncbi:GntR family transcriptional regulator [Novosphingobium pokkalii]|uniref:GntR family transcriptional regulator n=1 Tax=Novosphingobium pokkalii TaxID=1770194 RepID=UPI0036452EF1
MSKEPTIWLVLDRAAGDLEGQVYRAFRARILSGALPAGAPLPSTRSLAQALGLARSTVVAGYDRLAAEGYLRAARGSATRVAPLSPVPEEAARIARHHRRQWSRLPIRRGSCRCGPACRISMPFPTRSGRDACLPAPARCEFTTWAMPTSRACRCCAKPCSITCAAPAPWSPIRRKW